MSLKDKIKAARMRVWAILLWLLLWQITAMLIGKEFLLASPVSVLVRCYELLLGGVLLPAALSSAGRILLGFACALILGVLLAMLSIRHRWFSHLLAPLMGVLRALPVASFVLLVLLYLPPRALTGVIVFGAVFPLLYQATLSEYQRLDPKLIELSKVFRIPAHKRLLYLYALPVLRGMTDTCASAMGLAWKAGAAAELIAIPSGSIGEKLYTAKVYLLSGDLLSWTLMIVLLSALCSRLLRRAMLRGLRHFEGV